MELLIRYSWRLSPTYLRLLRYAFLAIVAGFISPSCFCSGLGDSVPADNAPSESLKIYFVDVEGGQATLFVTPEGESLLIDTGWPGNNGRDANRIVAAAKDAGIHKVDYVIITHFHTDHVGGVPQLTARIPVRSFVDHGDNRESGDKETVEGWNAYRDVLKNGKQKRISVKPGDTLPIQGMIASIVSSDGSLLHDATRNASNGNPGCQSAEHFPPDQTENHRSVGTLITFGKLRILDLGDLTREKEFDLMCPVNQLGKVDIYVVSHHGWRESGSPLLLNSIVPRVAIMDNGAKKGGSPSAWDAIKRSPRLEDLWQLHFSDEGGKEHNVADELIANPSGPDAGNYLKLTAWGDGSFEIYNSRTLKKKHYGPK